MRFLFVFFFIFMSGPMHSQNPVPPTTNVYTDCLLEYIDTLISYGSYKSGDTVLVAEKDYLKNDVNFTYNDVQLISINSKSIWKKTQKKQSVRIINVNPLEFGQKYNSINVVHFGITRKGRKYYMVNNGFQRFKVIFDCLKNKYVIEAISGH